MNRLRLSSYLLAGALLSVSGSAFAALLGPVVSNVTVVQSPDGSGNTKATITYDLITPFNPCAISLALSKDGGSTFPFPISTVSGDLTSVSTGTGHTITWSIATDYPDEEIADAIVRVTAEDGCPDAKNDSFLTNEDDVLSDNVLNDNGNGPDTGSSLSIVAVDGNPASVGSTVTTGLGVDLLVNSDGSFSYDPTSVGLNHLAEGETLDDSFTYTVQSGTSGCSKVATVSITINGTNDPPDISDFGVGIDEDLDTYSNSTSGSDPDNGDTVAFSISGVTPDGGGVTQQGGTYGTLTLNPEGSFTYDLDNSVTNALNEGEHVDDRFTVHTTDSHGVTSYDASILFTINGTNDAPTANPDSAPVYEDSGPVDINVLSNDTDPDSADSPTISAFGNGTYGTVSPNIGGTLQYTVDNNNASVNALAVGDTLSDSFDYTVTDNWGATSSTTVTITINGANDQPTANDDEITTDEDDTNLLSIDVLGNDTDPDTGDTPSVSQVQDSLFGYGTSGQSGDHVTYQVDNDQLQYLRSGDSVYDIVQYFIADGHGGVSSADVKIDIQGVNDAPNAVDDTFFTDEDAGPTTVNVLDNDTDVDQADFLTVTNVGTATYGTVSLGFDGVQYAVDQSATNYLASGESISDSFTYTISDTDGATSTASVNVTIFGEEDVPNAEDDLVTIDEDSGAVDISVLDNDSDPDASESISINSVGTPAYGSASIEGNAVRYTLDNSAVQYLGVGESLSDIFSYEIKDAYGVSDYANVIVTINGTNDEPTAIPDDATINEGDESVDVNVLSNDTDVDSFDFLSVDSVSGGTYGTLSINGDNTVKYELNNDDVAVDSLAPGQSITDSFDYTIVDSQGATSTATVSVTINGTNDAPDAVDDSYEVDENGNLSVFAPGVLSNDTDVDASDMPTVVGHTDPSNGSLLIQADGSFIYSPDVDFHGPDSFTYSIGDGNFGVDTATVSITVNEVVVDPNSPPTLTDDNVDYTIFQSLPQPTGNVLSNDSDPDFDELVVTNDGEISGSYGTLTLSSDGSYTYAPLEIFVAGGFGPEGESPTDQFSIMVSDQHGHDGTETLTFTFFQP
ncbi:MAG: Ig-like domain-containing protein [Candidatus Sumerlaeota bacterium]